MVMIAIQRFVDGLPSRKVYILETNVRYIESLLVALADWTKGIQIVIENDNVHITSDAELPDTARAIP